MHSSRDVLVQVLGGALQSLQSLKLRKAGISQQRHSPKFRPNNKACPTCKSTLNKNGGCHNRSCAKCVPAVGTALAPIAMPVYSHSVGRRQKNTKTIEIAYQIWSRGKWHLTEEELAVATFALEHYRAQSECPVTAAVFTSTPEVKRILEKVWAHA